MATRGTGRSGMSDLMGKVVSLQNLQVALKRVRKNKGSPGIDGMTVDELPDHLRENWPALREQLLAGRYQPSPVKRQLIPKGNGGLRELGIPTVLDRFIQQALLQVLQPLFDPSFSIHSYGFRPKRSVHQAVKAARAYVQQGLRIVVDVDLAKFLETSSHYPLPDGWSSKSPGRASGTLILKPFLRPRQTCAARSSPRFTRCNTLWRETPRMRVASIMGT